MPRKFIKQSNRIKATPVFSKQQPKVLSIPYLEKKVKEYLYPLIKKRDGNICISCGKFITSSYDYQAGHFAKAELCNPIYKYDPRNINTQCLTNHSKILLADLQYKQISDIKVGDALSTIDETNLQKTISYVEDISSFIPTDLYEVELEDGSKFYATKDHLVFANHKWTLVGEMYKLHKVYDILEYGKNI